MGKEPGWNWSGFFHARDSKQFFHGIRSTTRRHLKQESSVETQRNFNLLWVPRMWNVCLANSNMDEKTPNTETCGSPLLSLCVRCGELAADRVYVVQIRNKLFPFDATLSSTCWSSLQGSLSVWKFWKLENIFFPVGKRNFLRVWQGSWVYEVKVTAEHDFWSVSVFCKVTVFHMVFGPVFGRKRQCHKINQNLSFCTPIHVWWVFFNKQETSVRTANGQEKRKVFQAARLKLTGIVVDVFVVVDWSPPPAFLEHKRPAVLFDTKAGTLPTSPAVSLTSFVTSVIRRIRDSL